MLCSLPLLECLGRLRAGGRVVLLLDDDAHLRQEDAGDVRDVLHRHAHLVQPRADLGHVFALLSLSWWSATACLTAVVLADDDVHRERRGRVGRQLVGIQNLGVQVELVGPPSHGRRNPPHGHLVCEGEPSGGYNQGSSRSVIVKDLQLLVHHLSTEGKVLYGDIFYSAKEVVGTDAIPIVDLKGDVLPSIVHQEVMHVAVLPDRVACCFHNR
mmetsp:Transcript_108420/g.288571  ORF Transcript_108420/g.288571 Transcript_108420/m.288571 type:complete len:213 (-) Transcript_108420:890-1528(-)